jgi:hypothetical protein
MKLRLEVRLRWVERRTVRGARAAAIEPVPPRSLNIPNRDWRCGGHPSAAFRRRNQSKSSPCFVMLEPVISCSFGRIVPSDATTKSDSRQKRES